MIRNIVEYDAVGSESFELFVSMVNARITDGFQPFGSMVITQEDEDSKRPYYYQSLVRYESV